MTSLPYRFPDGSRVIAQITPSTQAFLSSLGQNAKGWNHSVPCSWVNPKNPLESNPKNQMTFSGWLPASGFFN